MDQFRTKKLSLNEKSRGGKKENPNEIKIQNSDRKYSNTIISCGMCLSDNLSELSNSEKVFLKQWMGGVFFFTFLLEEISLLHC